MSSFRSRRALLVVTTAMSLASACSSGGGGDAAPPLRTDPGQVAEENGGPAAAAPTTGLAELLGPAFEAAEARLGAVVDECLTGQGLPPLADGVPLAGAAGGFGITTSFGVLPDGTAVTGQEAGALDPPDEAAASAQMTALFGGHQADDDPAEGWGGGCFGRAAREVYGDPGPYFELEKALDALDSAVARDPRRQSALSGWRACMQEVAGTAPDDPESLVAGLADAAAEKYFAVPEPVERPTRDDSVDGAPAGELLPGVDGAAVAAGQADEERLAGAATSCAGRGLDAAETEVRSDLEARFVGDHRDLLARLDLGRLTR